MAGLFGSMRRGLAQANQPGGFVDRLSLFGAQMQDIGGSGGRGGRALGVQQQIAFRDQQAAAQRALQEQIAIEDRLRAALSPADGPNGSGTGAAPTIDQQLAALDEARLLNPEAADRFAPYVQGRQARQQAGELFAGDAVARALWESGLPEFRKAVSEQYSPQVVGPGGAQVVAGQRTVEQPTFSESGDTIVSRDSRGITPMWTRATPSISERTAMGRLDLDRSAAGATLSPGQVRYDLSGRPVAENENLTPGQEAAALKQQEGIEKASEAQAARYRQAANSISAIDRAMEQVGGWTAGPLSGLARIPGTPAANLAATIDTIEANLSFDALAEMRANSPTGGALGGIAVRELELLGSTVASLRQSQSPTQLRSNLARIKNHYERYLSAVAEAERGAPSQQPQGGVVAVSGPDEARRLPRGTRFRTPDGRVMVVQ